MCGEGVDLPPDISRTSNTPSTSMMRGFVQTVSTGSITGWSQEKKTGTDDGSGWVIFYCLQFFF